MGTFLQLGSFPLQPFIENGKSKNKSRNSHAVKFHTVFSTCMTICGYVEYIYTTFTKCHIKYDDMKYDDKISMTLF